MSNNTPTERMLDVQTLLLIDSFLGRRTSSRLSANRVVIYRLSRYTRTECEQLLRSTLESWGVTPPDTDLREFALTAGYALDTEQEQVHRALLSSSNVQVPLGFSDASRAVALKQLDLGTFCVCPKTTLSGEQVSIWCSKLIFKADIAENERGVFGLFAYKRELLQGLKGYPGTDSFESLYQLRIARDIAHRLRQGVMEETAFKENFAKVETYVKEESEKIDEMIKALPHISLCLDGGGARGEFSAAILAKLIEKLNNNNWTIKNFEHLDLVEIFDDLHGTSAGAILAAALWSDLYSVQNVPWEFFKLSRKIFAGGPKTDAISFGLIGIGQKESLYSALTVNDQIIRNLSFWEAQVSPLMRPIFPCLSIHTTDVTYNPYLPIKINTHDNTPIISTGGIPIPGELKLADYVRASMAAPGYLTVYPVATVLLGQRTPIPHVALVMADGGIMNNNPGLSSLTQNLAKVRVVEGEDPDNKSPIQVAGFTMISIGTGFKRTLQADPIAKVANLTKMSAQTTNDDMHLRSASRRDPTEFKYHRFQFPTNYDSLDEPRLEAYNEYQTIAASEEVQTVIDAAIADILPVLKLKKQLICARRKFRRDLLQRVMELVPAIHREHLHELARRKIVDTGEGWFSVMGFDGKKLLRVNNLFSSQPLVQLVNIELDNANHSHSTAFYSMQANPPTNNVKLCALLVSPQGAEPYYLGWSIGGPSFKVPQNLLGLNCVLNAVDVNGRFELHHPTFDTIKVRLDKDSVYVLTEDSVVPACLFA